MFSTIDQKGKINHFSSLLHLFACLCGWKRLRQWGGNINESWKMTVLESQRFSLRPGLLMSWKRCSRSFILTYWVQKYYQHQVLKVSTVLTMHQNASSYITVVFYILVLISVMHWLHFSFQCYGWSGWSVFPPIRCLLSECRVVCVKPQWPPERNKRVSAHH